MPLPTPMLDDRTYAQLRDELVRRIPVYNPEWTDHHESDPGVTLLELFASLGETALQRFNQIPEATRLAFLRLLRVPLRPAEPARAVVAFAADKARVGGVLVEAGTVVKAGAVAFEVLREVRAWPLESRAVARIGSALPGGDSGARARVAVADVVQARFLGKPPAGLQYYKPTPLPADPALPGVEAVDLGRSIDGTLWVAVLCLNGQKAAEVRPALFERMKSGSLSVGFVPADEAPAMRDVEACSGLETPGGGRPREAAALRWQASTARYERGEAQYRTLRVEGDTTQGLTASGTVLLRLPHDIEALGVPAEATGDIAGTGSLPPLLEDAAEAARVLFWLRGWRADGRRPGRVAWAGVNASEVEQRVRARGELLGVGTGEARQRARLVHAPVIAGSLVLEVDEPDGWREWSEVEGFHASGEDDRHYTLDRESGELLFGDGVEGRAPQIGERLRATRYHHGGGDAGNVPAKAINRVEGADGAKVSNPVRARGGAPTEELAEALERIPAELRRRDRAVTAGDFRELARATPGADVGRAECLPFFRPTSPGQQFAGVVSVVVWPRSDMRHPDAPSPEPGVLRDVCRWLDARRLVTTELYVLPPTYRAVGVGVSVVTKPGYGAEAVHAWVERVLRQYLSPLPPYGPEGGGWPLGRVVRGRELEAAVLQVEGIEYIAALRVDDLSAGPATAAPDRGRLVTLRAWEVPTLTAVVVQEGDVEAPEPAAEAAPPGPSAPPVPIPVPPERC